MAPEPPKPPKLTIPVSRSMLKFLPAGIVRDGCEIVLSGIPGAVILAIFIIGTSVLNIYTNLSGPNSWFAATYVPVVCLLPLVVGIVAPLVLERIRGIEMLTLRRSVVASCLSGLLGSLLGSLGLLISGFAVANSKPFGSALTGLPLMVVLVLVLVFISTLLSAIGGAILVLFLSRAMAPKSEG